MTPAALEVFAVFLRLGLTSFGGPVAHLGYFRDAFVTRRRWLDEAAYADLVALCQFLPGPASSQVGFAIGLKRAGWAGAAAAWLGFTAPSAALMLAVAWNVAWFATPAGQAIAHGLKLVAVSVVAHAVIGVARALCRTWTTGAIALAAAVAMLVLATAWMQPVVIAAGAMLGLMLHAAPAQGGAAAGAGLRGARALALFLGLLLVLPLLATLGGGFQIADAFYRAGALVFGGGHVVLPLLEAETVERGWLGRDAFMAGYGAAQALPGPLFSFAAYLGAAGGPMPGARGGLLALVCVFLPGLLLVSAALPWWEALKHQPRAVRLVAGANAAVVGVLAAALWTPVITTGIHSPTDAGLALAGLAALQWARAPTWLVVLLVATGGAAVAAGWP